MTTGKFTLTIHMVSSLDGIIAKKDNRVSWFETSDHHEKGVEVTAQDAAEDRLLCYGARTYGILGRRTERSERQQRSVCCPVSC